jgi:transcriptional regulator with XRE-family HTH domain
MTKRSADEGRRIHAARRIAKLSQSKLATQVEAAGATVVWRWEDGRSRPGDEYLAKLAEKLGVTAAWLRFGVGRNPRGFEEACREIDRERAELEARRAARKAS